MIDRIKRAFLGGWTEGRSKSFRDQLTIHANLDLRLYGPDGELKARRRVHNATTDAGKYGAADQFLLSPTLPKPGWVEVGTGSPAATKLGAYVAGSRTAFDSKLRALGVVTTVTTLAAGVGTGELTEAGMFDVVTQDTANMWASASFAAVNKLAADSLVITWTLTVA